MKSASLAVILMAYSVDAFTGLRNLCQLEGIRNPPTIDRTYRVIGGSNDLSYDNDASSITLKEFMREKCIVNQTANYYLPPKKNPQRMENLMEGMQVACKTIANIVGRVGLTDLHKSYAGRYVNVDGEHQQHENLNVIVNAVLKSTFQDAGGKVITFTTEEPLPIFVERAFNSKYDAIIQPFDVSSSIDASITTGTIFGIWEGIDPLVRSREGKECSSEASECSLLKPIQIGQKLIAAGYCMYSSSTILVFTMGDGVNGFTLDSTRGEFILTHPDICIPTWGKIYSFDEAKFSDWLPNLQEYITKLREGHGKTGKKYSSRYIGGIVGDVHRTILYGGIFGSPGDEHNPDGKFHLLYEAAPLSFIIEQAGGLNDIHQKVPVFLGSPGDVNELVDHISTHYSQIHGYVESIIDYYWILWRVKDRARLLSNQVLC